jgi:predicted DNA-binding transcriptional regulator AlpA
MSPMTPDEKRGQLLLRFEDLRLFGICYSRAQVYRKMADGSFPRTVKLGGNRVVWKREEILEWIKQLR